MMLEILTGDALAMLKTLPDESVQCCVTSPPYWALRDYGHPEQIGLEKTPEEFVAKIVEVFREVRRVLKADGTLWCNLGDSYAGSWGAQGRQGETGELAGRSIVAARQISVAAKRASKTGSVTRLDGLKPKDLVGIPWRVAFALQADGWYLRSDIIWSKPNPMPESVTDRPTKAHEYLFLLSKSERYFYDAGAIKERAIADHPAGNKTHKGATAYENGATEHRTKQGLITYAQKAVIDPTRNKRTVWTVPTAPYSEAHFATYPPDLIRPCILAGSRPGDTILDPFGGSGTTGMVALEMGRKAVLIELNPDYVDLIRKRCTVTIGLPLGNAA